MRISWFSKKKVEAEEGTEVVEEKDQNDSPTVVEKAPKQTVAMVPILNWRTVAYVAIGLVLGAALGFIYWLVGPSGTTSSDVAISTFDQQVPTGGITQTLKGENIGPWESDVKIQVVSPGSTYSTPLELRNMGEYYVAKASSYPFFEFLSKELNEVTLEYNYTNSTLDQMITTDFEIFEETPSIELKVIAPTLDETVFLVTHIPEVFIDYLVAEEKERQKREYQSTLQAIEATKTAIIEAEAEFESLLEQEVSSNLINNPTYIALNSKIESLQEQLEVQADELSVSIAIGDFENSGSVQQDSQELLLDIEIVKRAIAEKTEELTEIEQILAANDINSNPTYIELNNKILGLEGEVEWMIHGGYSRPTSGEQVWVTGIAQMIADGNTSSTAYDEKLTTLQEIITKMTDFQKEVASLVIEINHQNSAIDLDRQIVQSEVDALNNELALLLDTLPPSSGSAMGDNAQDLQAAFDRTSSALAEAQKELALLDVSDESEVIKAAELDYLIAQTRVDNLYSELAVLNDKLGSLLVSEATDAEIDNLAIGVPEIPVPIISMRLRDVILLGGIIGIALAWVILNRKWIIKGLSSSSAERTEKEDEE